MSSGVDPRLSSPEVEEQYRWASELWLGMLREDKRSASMAYQDSGGLWEHSACLGAYSSSGQAGDGWDTTRPGGLQRLRRPVLVSFSATTVYQKENVQIVVGTELLQQLRQQNFFCSEWS